MTEDDDIVGKISCQLKSCRHNREKKCWRPGGPQAFNTIRAVMGFGLDCLVYEPKARGKFSKLILGDAH